jgi:hypothetical protein
MFRYAQHDTPVMPGIFVKLHYRRAVQGETFKMEYLSINAGGEQ